MFGFSPFRKGGVPRSKEALAALGVEKAKKGLERERKGAKGLDEIRLSVQERESAVEEESKWDRDDMIAWAKTIGDDWSDNEDWVDETFEFHPDGKIKCTLKKLDLSDTSISEIPARLEVEVLWADNTDIKSIPSNIKGRVLNVGNTDVSVIPDGLNVEVVNLINTRVTEMPLNTGAIKRINVKEHQTALKASAEALGIEVFIIP